MCVCVCVCVCVVNVRLCVEPSEWYYLYTDISSMSSLLCTSQTSCYSAAHWQVSIMCLSVRSAEYGCWSFWSQHIMWITDVRYGVKCTTLTQIICCSAESWYQLSSVLCCHKTQLHSLSSWCSIFITEWQAEDDVLWNSVVWQFNIVFLLVHIASLCALFLHSDTACITFDDESRRICCCC